MQRNPNCDIFYERKKIPMGLSPKNSSKKDWITPKAINLALSETEGKTLIDLPEGTYATKNGGSTPGGS